jgi:preprotein translocase subunit SecA
MERLRGRRSVENPRSLSVGTPYLERTDRHEDRLDGTLLNGWGRVTSYLPSAIGRKGFDRVTHGAERAEAQLSVLTDRALRQRADELRERLVSASQSSDETAVAFALAREAARRHAGMRHFAVQLLGGAAMMGGALAEMQTGEGKSLTALLPAITAALMRRPVHIVTVNDYLARRDAEQFRSVYNALGLTVGLVEHGQQFRDRQRAYACDVTYCTNKELVFDYLRDRLALGSRRAHARLLVEELFQDRAVGAPRKLLLRGLNFAIVDEADSILIDEARTPLILSDIQASAANDNDVYQTALDLAKRLAPGDDFHLRAGEKAIALTARGARRAADLTKGLLGVWAIRRAREELLQQALTAEHFFQRDVQYIVTQGKVQIVDEYTGRVMPDRSWEGGLHQLIEAKENCAITERNQTLARITYQRFFRRYLHLCGMTGTAIEVAGELRAVYGLRVVRIPTNRPLKRMNCGTRIFSTAEDKWSAVVESVREATRHRRAVLIGTRSVDASEHLGKLLLREGLQPVILNARQDQQEAKIVADAGQPCRVTVATNMAGRGTDILLHADVRAKGGLHVVLTEFHESRRIDRQLFGRAGRQGDPGSFESIVAFDDELFRRFAGKQLLHIANGLLRQGRQVPTVLGQFLRARSQSAAERTHARARQRTLAEDHRSNRALGFSGIE